MSSVEFSKASLVVFASSSKRGKAKLAFCDAMFVGPFFEEDVPRTTIVCWFLS